ncbi:GID complex subunit 4, VID24 [Dissophora globulifera]|uniref:GID complex subunit 4, VID24 n=1 Tax=Dissophora globulifera TaxID=979702 RepID=A0A9P6UR90_9FUNG|nr:GID complex subunit 4, VID24 [Dissophora globulifera]
MPVFKQVSPSTDSLPTTPSSDASPQLLCTCPPYPFDEHAGDALSTVSAASAAGSDNNHLASGGLAVAAPLEQPSQQQAPLSLPRRHVATCAVHSSHAMALLKQKAKQQQQLQLERQREQEERRRNPFAPVRVAPSRTFDLYAGSQFRGKQRSGSHSYDVMVDIKHVDLNNSFLCGYLHINGLTDEYPELTTYFEAEIIGPKHSFLTHKWDADELTDEEHWTLFEPFKCFARSVFNGLDGQDSDEDMSDSNPSLRSSRHQYHCDPLKYHHQNENVVFMRWKEHFLVPDHRVQGISGASFAGFYYICYNKITGEISGYYYHQSSEKFQQLLLKHVDERSFAAFEFR